MCVCVCIGLGWVRGRVRKEGFALSSVYTGDRWCTRLPSKVSPPAIPGVISPVEIAWCLISRLTEASTPAPGMYKISKVRHDPIGF